MLVSGSITNPTLLAEDKAKSSQIAVASSPITTKVEAGISKPDSSSKQKNQNVKNNLGVEEAVREYFADIPLMVEISKCESRFRQFDTTGDVLRGKVNANDVGALQINESYHLKRSEKLGYDIHSLQGNMEYARLLYQESGPQPWASSYPCWGKSPLAGNFKPKARTPVITTAVPVTVTPVVTEANTSVNTSEMVNVNEPVLTTVPNTATVLAER